MRSIIINVVCTVAAACVFALVLVNWAIGCGEPVYRADGTYSTGACLFIPYEVKEGTWR